MTPELQYCLDGAVECCDITSDMVVFFETLHPDPNGWYDGVDALPYREGLFREAVEREFMAHWPTLPREKQIPLAVIAMRGLGYQVRELAASVAHLAIDDAIHEANGRRARQIAGNRAKLRRMIESDFHLSKFQRLIERLTERAYEVFVDADPDRVLELTSEFLDDVDQIHNERLVRRRAALLRECRPTKRQLRDNRKVIRKSYAMMERVIGRESAKMFITGEMVEIIGKLHTFRVRRARGLADRGHGALDITLADARGRLLCDLCVYWSSTPCMDQVAALALSVAAGQEDEVIRTANYFNHRQHFEAAYRQSPETFKKTSIDVELAVFRDQSMKREYMPFVKRRAEFLIRGMLSRSSRRMLDAIAL